MYRSITLIGPQCIGKSTIAKALSSVYSYPVIDADVHFQSKHGTIADFVAKNSWEKFREKEHEMYPQIYEQFSGQFILDTGGGAVANDHERDNQTKLQHENATLFQKNGPVILIGYSFNLVETANLIALRKNHDPQSSTMRPALTLAGDTSAAMYQMLRSRWNRYVRAAHHVVLMKEHTTISAIKEIADFVRTNY